MLIDQTHSRAVVIVMAPDPPVALKEVGTLETEDWHFTTLGSTSDMWEDVQADANATERRLALAPRAMGATRKGLRRSTDRI